MSLSWSKNASLKYNKNIFRFILMFTSKKDDYSAGVKKQRTGNQTINGFREKRSAVTLYPWQLSFRAIREKVNGPVQDGKLEIKTTHSIKISKNSNLRHKVS